MDYEGSRDRICEPDFCRFIDFVGRKEDVDEFGLRVACTTKLAGSGLEALITDRACGWSTMNRFCRTLMQLTPLPKYAMRRDGELSWWCRGTNCLDTGERDMELFVVQRIVDLVTRMIGAPFRPRKLLLQTGVEGNIREFPSFADTEITLASPITAIAIPHRLLLRALSPNVIDDPSHAGFLRSVREEFNRRIELGIHASEALIADTHGLNRRSFQRTLNAAGTTYRQLADEMLFAKAVEMLKQTDVKNADIAHQLGFNHQSNFSRSFSRIAGVSPTTYRQGLIQGKFRDEDWQSKPTADPS